VKIDLDAELKGYDGVVLKPKESEDKVLTLGGACCNALMANFDDEKRLEGKKKLERHVLAHRIYQGGEQDLSLDDLALLKKLIGKAYGARVVGPAFLLLEGPKKNGNGTDPS